MNLNTLLEKIDYKVLKGTVDININKLVYDSREVKQGDVFVCISGSLRDAHDFLDEVIKKGVAAIIVEKDVLVSEDITVIKVDNTRYALACMSAAYFGHPAEKLTTIGITGTKGKTTSTYMIKSVLDELGYKTGLIGTIEMIIGDERIPAVNTTPESYILQESLAKMVDSGCKAVVMEVSSQGLMLHRVSGFVFDYGIFTNLTKDHIGGNEHKDFDEYLYWKSQLFKNCKHGIVNLDDKHVEKILEGSDCTLETFSINKDSDFKASEIELFEGKGVLGSEFQLTGKINTKIKIKIPGKFSIYNSLVAIAICSHFTEDLDLIKRVLSIVKVNGRVEIVPVSDKFTFMIDYAHNGISLESLLVSLKEYNPKRIVTIFGCGGNRDRNRRYEMGEVSSNLSGLSIVTSDNPRNEEPENIINDIIVGIKKGKGEYVAIIDRREAIDYAIKNAKMGDIIVLAGKGHETYQEIKGIKYHMDDRELIAEIKEEYYGVEA